MSNLFIHSTTHNGSKGGYCHKQNTAKEDLTIGIVFITMIISFFVIAKIIFKIMDFILK